MKKLKPGDLCEVIPAPGYMLEHQSPELVGQHVTLLKYLEDYERQLDNILLRVPLAWLVETRDARKLILTELTLMKIDYDGANPSTWDKCVWRPNG